MFSCANCRQTFDKRSSRDAHSRKAHLNEFKDERGILHQRGAGRLFKCHLCILTFEDSKNFKKHLSLHYKNIEQSQEKTALTSERVDLIVVEDSTEDTRSSKVSDSPQSSERNQDDKLSENGDGTQGTLLFIFSVVVQDVFVDSSRFSEKELEECRRSSSKESNDEHEINHQRSSNTFGIRKNRLKIFTKRFTPRHIRIKLNGPERRRHHYFGRVIEFVKEENKNNLQKSSSQITKLAAYYAKKFDFSRATRIEKYLYGKLRDKCCELIDLNGSIEFCLEESDGEAYQKKWILFELTDAVYQQVHSVVNKFIESKEFRTVFDTWVNSDLNHITPRPENIRRFSN